MAEEPSRSQPINNTLLRRLVTLAAIKFWGRFCSHSSCVLFLSKKVCVKYGTFTDLSEAATMRFISEHTSIPVPKVYCAFVHKNKTYIVMQRIEGVIIGLGWESRTEESKEKLANQLKTMINQMRSIIPTQGQGVSSVDGGSLCDPRLPGGSLRDRHGPFKTFGDFHKHIRQGNDSAPSSRPQWQSVLDAHKRERPLRFTHGDLSCLNILVKGDNAVGIVDWETAGWYPSYWEYTSAANGTPLFDFWWKDIDRFLEPFPAELTMEKLRNRFFGMYPEY